MPCRLRAATRGVFAGIPTPTAVLLLVFQRKSQIPILLAPGARPFDYVEPGSPSDLRPGIPVGGMQLAAAEVERPR